MTSIDLKKVQLSINNQPVRPGSGSADYVELNEGGDRIKTTKGVDGSYVTSKVYDVIDSLTVTAFRGSNVYNQLQEYKNNGHPFIVSVRDYNPDTAECWVSKTTFVKANDNIKVGSSDGVKFTLECPDGLIRQ